MVRRLAILAIACLGLFGPETATPALAQTVAPKIVPHSARYRLSLLETRMGDISSFTGLMRFDVIRTCQDWTTESELHMVADMDGAASFNLTVDHKAHEALDGSWLAFESTADTPNGKEVIAGRAERRPDGSVVANFTAPKNGTLALPPETRFPIDTIQWNLDALWGKNQRLLTYILFDGSDPFAWRATDLVAGKPVAPRADVSDPNGLLVGQMKRIVSALFEVGKQDSEPTTTYISDTLPNGVIVRMTIDIGVMVAEAELVEVLAVPEPGC